MPDELHIVLPPAPSVNALYVPRRGGGIGYTKVARQWKKTARAMCAVQAYQQGWEPLDCYCRVSFRPYWPDRLLRDVSNLHKVVLDVLTTVVYRDDSLALAHDDVPRLDRQNPRLELTVTVEPGCQRVVWKRKQNRRTR